MGERDLIARIRRLVTPPPGVVGIGDDCAVLPADTKNLVVTADALVAGVHFDPAFHPAELVGRKAAAVNLSDIAAMGAEPRWALLCLAVPGTVDDGTLDRLLVGFVACLAEYGAVLVGGDTVATPGPLTLAVTAGGRCDRPVYRSGARPGDLVVVAGETGRAAAGLDLCRAGLGDDPGFAPLVAAHRDPRPQVALGCALAAGNLVHAMQDVSDGIATDLAHICAASGVGAEICEADLPRSRLLEAAAARLSADPLAWQLAGGDDYCLLATLAAHDLAGAQQLAAGLGETLQPVGRIVEGNGVTLVTRDGRRRDITFQGYEHLAADKGEGRR